jgi:predicted N-acyltransferase
MSQELPLQLKVASSLEDIAEPAWNALVRGDPSSTPFMEWAWLHAFEASGTVAPSAGWHPSHLTLWRGNHLVAAAPAYLKDDSYGEFVFDWSWASAAERLGIRYYPKLVLGAPLSPATGSRVLVAPGEDRRARTDELLRGALELAKSQGLSSVHILFCTEEETGFLERAGFALRQGVQYHWQNHGYGTFDDFLARFVSKRRTQLRRERRALAEQRLTLREVRGEALAEVDPALVHALYVSTVDKHPFGRRHLNLDFFKQVLTRFRHRVELVLAEDAKQGGKVVAGAFNVRGDDALYGRYWGCLEERPFLHFNVCLYRPIEDAIERRLSRFEPGAGGEHKLVRGFEPTLTHSAHYLFHPVLDRAVREFLAHERNAIREGLPALRAETGLKNLV